MVSCDNDKVISGQTLFTRNFTLICLANLCSCMSSYSIMPVLPLYLMDELHCQTNIMGLALAVFPFVALLFRPVSGIITDLFNRKYVLLISTLCCAVLFPAILAATGIMLFMLIRLLHGASFSAMTTSQATMAVAFIPQGKLGTGIGIYSSTLSLGMILGPMMGLFVADTFSYASAFWVPFTFALTGVLLLLFIRTPVRHGIKPKKFSRDMFFMKDGLWPLLALLLAAFMNGMIVNYVSVLARDLDLEAYASLYFLLMGLGLLLSRLFSGSIVDRGFLVELVVTTEILTVGAALWTATASSPAVFLTSGALLGISIGALIPSYQTILVRLADKDRQGVANSMFYIGMDGGVCLSLLSGGMVAGILSMKEAFQLGALGQIVALVIFLAFVTPQYRRRTGEQSNHLLQRLWHHLYRT